MSPNETVAFTGLTAVRTIRAHASHDTRRREPLIAQLAPVTVPLEAFLSQSFHVSSPPGNDRDENVLCGCNVGQKLQAPRQAAQAKSGAGFIAPLAARQRSRPYPSAACRVEGFPGFQG
jgi:hypothetical protein